MQNALPCKKLLPENTSYATTTKIPGYIGSPLSSEGSINIPLQSTPNDKLKRAVIPTKDNPPPEMSEWLVQFQVELMLQIH